jgi:NADPH:quinone reductase-like Zn-dependent oxidoreductase
MGAYAEYVAVPENVLVAKPANISFEQAAAVPQAAVVALQGLRNNGEIKAGDKVLINGASGGVGTFAVQIAKAYDAEVTGVCSAQNLDLVRSIGADHVIDYKQKDFTQAAERYDLILDIVANRSTSDYMRALTPTGQYVAVAFNPASLFFGGMISKSNGKKTSSLVHKPNPQDLAFIGELLEGNKVVPVIDRQYSLSELPAAMQYLDSGQHHGKVVIKVQKE